MSEKTEIEIGFSDSVSLQAAYEAIQDRVEEAEMSGFPALFYLGKDGVPAGEFEKVEVTGNDGDERCKLTCTVRLMDTVAGRILEQVGHFRLSAKFSGKLTEEVVNYEGMKAIITPVEQKEEAK